MINKTTAMMNSDVWSVNMNDSWQVLLWCRELGLTKTELESAVYAAGPLIANVIHFLGQEKALMTLPPMPVAQAAGTATTVRRTLTRSPF